MLRSLPAVAWERDARTGRYTYINEAALGLLGFSADEWTVEGFWEAHVHPEDRAVAEGHFHRLRESGAPYDAEYRLRCRTGGYVWVRDIASVTVAHEQPTRIYGVMVDVTARRLAEQAQASQYARLRRQNLALLSLATRDASSAGDLGAALRALTEAAAHALAVARVGIWWFTPEALSCLDLYDARTGAHHSGVELSIREHPVYFAAINQERALCADDVYRDPRLVELAGTFLRELGITSMMDAPVRVGGRVVAIVCHEHVGEPRRWTADEQQFAASMADLVALAVEARDRRRAEVALRTSQARTEAVVQASLDAMVVVDRDGRIVEFNRAAEAMFGRAREEVLGADLVATLVAERERDRVRSTLATCLERGPHLSDERLELCAVGRDREFLAEVRAFAFPEEGTALLAAFVRDLTRSDGAGTALRGEHDRLEQLMEERAAPLRAALLELESYSFTLAHELRGPVRALDAFSQLLAEQYGPGLGENGARYIARIRSASTRMGELVRDITLLSRVSAVDVRRERVDLAAVASGIAAELREQDPERRVIFEVAPTAWAMCDPGLARILLENLLRNAWKFTSHHATARITFQTQEADGETVYCVRDDGAGFDAAFAARLFEPFQRLHGNREFEGTGIGLAVVRRIVDRHGGRVWAEGAPEKGATFFFTLPGPREGHTEEG